jgi:PIN domain nuclease of toxin-antitoxin system
MGKWQLNRPYEEFIDIGLRQNGFVVLPVLPIHVLPIHTARLIVLPFHHKDPFDRLLVAQALIEQVLIVSADLQLDSYGIYRFWKRAHDYGNKGVRNGC